MSTTVTTAPVAKELRFPGKWSLSIKPVILLLFCAALAAAFLVLAYKSKWPGAGLAVSPVNVATLLAPLVLAAAFIERAVEIVISPWRDGRATVLENRLSALQSAAVPLDPIAAAQLQQQVNAAGTDFQAYKSQTQQLAFCVSITISLCAALVGVRALGAFLPAVPNMTLTGLQGRWFQVFDVGLTACLLAGGADGIHSAVNMVTTFFETTAQKTGSGNGTGN